MQESIKKIETGLKDLIEETKLGNEGLIVRSKVLNNLQGLIKNIQLHSQRRLTAKFQTDPAGKVEDLFARFETAMGAIK